MESNHENSKCHKNRSEIIKRGNNIIEDKRNILKEEQPFSYKKTKDQKALIYWNNKEVMIIKGKDFQKLEQKEQSGDAYAMQLFLAKLTGNFKHGNEKKK